MTVFDSRDPRYKSPFGAVPCGTAVTFGEFAGCRGETPLLPCPGGFSGVFTPLERY